MWRVCKGKEIINPGARVENSERSVNRKKKMLPKNSLSEKKRINRRNAWGSFVIQA